MPHVNAIAPGIPAPAAGLPLLWILASPHAGDNRQLLTLAEALGWPYELKRLAFRRREALVRLTASPSLAAVDSASRRLIAPPYPDLVIAAGRPTEAVAFWIRRHGNPSAKLVYVGTPWTIDHFDLVITTPQYRLPDRANVLHNSLPLHDIDPRNLTLATAAWSERLAALPRPLTAVLVGGSSGPYVFSPAAGARLGQQANRIAQNEGGSLLVSTSPRTPPAVAEALFAAISVPHHGHRFHGGAGENPYFAYLALAKRIIVTADSISMMTEAAATGKPVLLFDFEEKKRAMRAELAGPADGDKLPPPHWLGRDLSSTAFRLAMRFGPPRWSRDLRIVHRALTETGQASWIDDPRPAIRSPQTGELERSVSRVRALLGSQHSESR